MASKDNVRVLFISLVIIKDMTKRGIYPDLIKCFIKNGHHVTILSPVERREKGSTEVIHGEGYTNIRYKTLNNTKTNYVEKLLSTLLIDWYLLRVLKRRLEGSYDIVVFATPPITLNRSIEYLKGKFDVPFYLLLKDIFPDNIRDLGLISTKSILFKYFKNIEKKLYSKADYIGCMSQANVDYLLDNHPEIDPAIVEINPNTIDYLEVNKSASIIRGLREKYKITEDAIVIFYGGNLGKPQMIDFLIEVMQMKLEDKAIHFFIIGDGTDFPKIESWKNKTKAPNVSLLNFVPKAEYDQIAHIADVGLVLLDRRFVIPNFPNRILSYMENSIPVLLATDVNTDIGSMAVENGFGLWCEAGDAKSFIELLDRYVDMGKEERVQMGNVGNIYMRKHFPIERSYNAIISKLNYN
jgi:glycosyltransferase involved in cell wall biosynthesis